MYEYLKSTEFKEIILMLLNDLLGKISTIEEHLPHMDEEMIDSFVQEVIKFAPSDDVPFLKDKLKAELMKKKSLDPYATEIVLEEPYEYEEKYVLFIDIIGFKNLIETKESVDIKTIYDFIRYHIRENSLSSVMWCIIPDEVLNEISYVIMSDSIAMSFPKNKHGILALIMYCITIQMKLLDLDFHVLFRGGISVGEIYCHGQICYGPALIEAIELEKLAKNPRIIMPKDLFTDIRADTDDNNKIIIDAFIKEDIDGFYYIDYIDLLPLYNNRALRLKALIENELANASSPYFSKYVWLRIKFNKSLEKFVTLGKLARSSSAFEKMYIDEFV